MGINIGTKLGEYIGDIRRIKKKSGGDSSSDNNSGSGGSGSGNSGSSDTGS